MSRPLSVVTVNGSYSSPSKTGALIGLVADQIAASYPCELAEINIRELGPDLGQALERDQVSPALAEALEKVEKADVLIVGSPVFRGGYTGLFKQFFDLVEVYALANKPVFMVASGGGDRHALMLESHMRSLFAFFQAHCAPVAIYGSSKDFDRTTLLDPSIYGRIEMAVEDMKVVLDALAL